MLKNYFDLELDNNQFTIPENIRDLIEYCYEQYADRVFIIDKGVEYTYKEVYKYIRNVHQVLVSQKHNKQDVIGIYESRGIDFVIGALAIMSTNYSCVFIPENCSKDLFLDLLTNYKFNTVLLNVMQNLSLAQSLKTERSFLRAELLDIGLLQRAPIGSQCANKWYDNIDKNNSAAILFTSGTEQIPRGVELTHKNLMIGMRNGLLGFKEVGYNEDGQIYQLTIPLTHSFGLIRNLLCCMYTGSTLIISADNKSIFADMQKYNPTRLVTVPGFCDIILQMVEAGMPNIMGTKLEYIVTGGASLNKKTIDGFKKLNIPIYNGYGMTETANLFTGNAQSWEYQEAIGHVYPNTDYRITNEGELLVKGDNIFKKYFRATKSPFDNNGYFHTGDLVAKDDDTGLLYFVGRKKQMIVLDSGINIIPTIVEKQIINTIDFIDECYVYTPDNKILVCEFYSKTNPTDYDVLDKINNMFFDYKITKLIKKDTPLPKTNKMEIKRGNIE